jgi:hypothetical protein
MLGPFTETHFAEFLCYPSQIIIMLVRLSLFPSNHRCHAQIVKFIMKFDIFFHGLVITVLYKSYLNSSPTIICNHNIKLNHRAFFQY